MSARVSSAIARPARTGGQAGAGFVTAALLDTFLNLSDEQVLLIALLLTPVYSFIQTFIENQIGAGLLRAVPPKTEPIVDTPEPHGRPEEGYADPRLAIVISVVALILAIIAVLGTNVVVR